MIDIKQSTLLSELLKRSSSMYGGDGSHPSVERFLLATIQWVQEADKEHADRETEAMRSILGNIADVERFRTALSQDAEGEAEVGLLEELAVDERLYVAQLKAVAEGLDCITADGFLAAVLADPTPAIRAAFEDQEKIEQPSGEQPTGEPALFFSQLEQIKGMLDQAIGLTGDESREQPAAAAAPSAPAAPPASQPEPAAPVDTKTEIAALVEETKSLRRLLLGKIYGQDHAVSVFAGGYFQARMLSLLDKKRRRPSATFLFAGPPGVGKTFLAETAAEALQRPFRRFDMSEYSHDESNLEFCGSDKVYKNAKAGNVTSFVAEHPRCVLLFDEIEKAHINVIHLFLQLLDAGRLRDNYTDEEVSFTDTILIFTTNAGRGLYADSESGDFSDLSRKVIIKALQKDVNPATGNPYFPGAICSRFAAGNVVMFNHISAYNLRAIAQKELERHAANLQNETGITLSVEEGVYTALLLCEGGLADARTVRARAESFFNSELYELLRLVASEKSGCDVKALDEISVRLDFEGAGEEVKSLFRDGEKTQLLLLSDPKTVKRCSGLLPDCTVHGVSGAEEALALMRRNDIDLVLLDMGCGAAADTGCLNLADVASPARDLFQTLRETRKELPIYLLDTEATLGEEELSSFIANGARGRLQPNEHFAAELGRIAQALHQQAAMVSLARSNKLLSFETAQKISKDGKHAEICLFDFSLALAVDAEDGKHVLQTASRPTVKMADVIGASDAKKELTYFIDYLKNPKKYLATGVKAPKGVLLYGPPGTGKTMLAKAMAHESDVAFIAAEGNAFLKKYVGEGSEAVHELFRTARKYAPAILFIDEIDAIGKERRGGENSGGSEATLTAFLTEMDGFVSDPGKPVFVLAATNFEVEPGTPRSLDPALLRRFDRRVYIDLPNKGERIRFLQKKIADNPALAISQETVDHIAVRATGMSLAELDSAVELALRSAIRSGSTTVTDAIFEEAFETFHSGEKKKWNPDQLTRVARHEAGHAFLCWQAGQTPSYLTVVARGDHGGYMQHAEQEGKAIYTIDELLARIRTSLGGRAAEMVYYGQRDGISTGASGDLMSATALARSLVCRYGMESSFGLAVMDEQEMRNGPAATEVRAAVNRILQEQMQQAISLIEENRAAMDRLVDLLLERNHLNGEEIAQALSGI